MSTQRSQLLRFLVEDFESFKTMYAHIDEFQLTNAHLLTITRRGSLANSAWMLQALDLDYTQHCGLIHLESRCLVNKINAARAHGVRTAAYDRDIAMLRRSGNILMRVGGARWPLGCRRDHLMEVLDNAPLSEFFLLHELLAGLCDRNGRAAVLDVHDIQMLRILDTAARSPSHMWLMRAAVVRAAWCGRDTVEIEDGCVRWRGVDPKAVAIPDLAAMLGPIPAIHCWYELMPSATETYKIENNSVVMYWGHMTAGQSHMFWGGMFDNKGIWWHEKQPGCETHAILRCVE